MVLKNAAIKGHLMRFKHPLSEPTLMIFFGFLGMLVVFTT
ncbi:hypothetical protein FDI40_gp440 [Agrobacterium phage Atu_ph07]|uniref:Uncharacterized protein n=1 Tax=Agrobacterium phage Atu_ph07 TaxID=2024264 RepID=A0A2L0V091_9CAUD|nr:hypothetical protein FDI40_gp440 [Agrobacterium phage Atu_ph07]AUZ95199.1 hypothetical protein [Agrobacterium phage Atu_ph07]